VGSIIVPSEDFRNVVLRGANVASYKYALAKSILALAEAGAARIQGCRGGSWFESRCGPRGETLWPQTG
jgi:hypothetical protein